MRPGLNSLNGRWDLCVVTLQSSLCRLPELTWAASIVFCFPASHLFYPPPSVSPFLLFLFPISSISLVPHFPCEASLGIMGSKGQCLSGICDLAWEGRGSGDNSTLSGPLNKQHFVKSGHHFSVSKQTCRSLQGQLSACWKCVGLENLRRIETLFVTQSLKLPQHVCTLHPLV